MLCKVISEYTHRQTLEFTNLVLEILSYWQTTTLSKCSKLTNIHQIGENDNRGSSIKEHGWNVEKMCVIEMPRIKKGKAQNTVVDHYVEHPCFKKLAGIFVRDVVLAAQRLLLGTLILVLAIRINVVIIVVIIIVVVIVIVVIVFVVLVTGVLSTVNLRKHNLIQLFYFYLLLSFDKGLSSFLEV